MMIVEFVVVMIVHVQMNVAYQMVTIPLVPMHAVCPMVITHPVLTVQTLQMVVL